MDCERVREEFVERLTGRLDENRFKVIDEHLASCAECRSETERMRELWTELGALTVPTANGSAARVERMVDARARELSAANPSSQRVSPIPRAAILAIGLAASLLIGVMLGRGSTSTPSTPSAPGGTTMATTGNTERYVLLLHGPARNRTTAADAAADSANEAALVAEYSAWAGRLAGEGKLLAGEKLADDPHSMLAANGAVDVPRFTADEVGGFFIIQAADSAEAYRIARECPHLKHGGTIQVRRIEPT
jgi:hypothetical protein